MATVTNWRGIAGDAAVNLPVVGSRAVMAYARADLVAADDTAGSFSVTFVNMRTIVGFAVQLVDSGNNVVTDDIDITVSGNVITIADGVRTLAANQIAHIFVVGPSRL